ncbi:MAG: hypothetical protein PHR35_11945 [Kiritimatiellae bacterium]|nr:hypothetical protein [Kiritimatiellia bacterium]
MTRTDDDGYIYPLGECVGGHCILCVGVDVEIKRFTLRNSWGRAWGRQGDCYVHFDDMAALLDQDGEAAFLVGRHVLDATTVAPRLPWWRRIFSL